MKQYLYNLTPAGEPVDGLLEIRPNVWLMSAEETPPLMFTVDEVGRILRWHRPVVEMFIELGLLEAIDVRGSVRITARSLAEFVLALEEEGR